jgi:hypothetical protein
MRMSSMVRTTSRRGMYKTIFNSQLLSVTEKPRKSFYAHRNAVIDVKWSLDDEYLV